MDKKNIIVYSLPRSGTNFLCDTLQKSLSNCMNLGEFLHHPKDFYRNIPSNIATPDEACFVFNGTYNYKVNLTKIDDIINFYKNYDYTIMKIQYWGLQNIYLNSKKWFDKISANSFNIYLIRNDLIRSAISRLVAEKIKAYTHEQEIAVLYKNPELLNDFNYNYETMRNTHSCIINDWKWLYKNIPPGCVTVNYENIANVESEEWDYLKKFLNIKHISRECCFKKQDKSKFISWYDQYIEQNKNELPLFYKDIDLHE